MPIATITKTVILTDGTIQKTIEKQHKDKEGNILRILSRTTETVPPPDSGAVVNSSVVPPGAAALEDPAEDYLVARLRRQTQSKRSSSSDHRPVNDSSVPVSKSDLSIHSDTKKKDQPVSSVGSTSGSIRLHDDTSPTSSFHSLGEATSDSSHGDSLIEHLRRVSVQNKTAQPQNPVQRSSTVKPPAIAHAVAVPQPNPTVFVPPTLPTRVATPAIPQQATAQPMRIQTTAVPQPSSMQSAPPVRIQTTAVPQGLPTHLPAVITRPQPQPSRPQIDPQNGQNLELAEGIVDLAETAQELFGGGDDDNEDEGITFNVNIGGQQQSERLDAIRNGLRWGRVGLRAARLGADLLGLGDSGELLEAAVAAADCDE